MCLFKSFYFLWQSRPKNFFVWENIVYQCKYPLVFHIFSHHIKHSYVTITQKSCLASNVVYIQLCVFWLHFFQLWHTWIWGHICTIHFVHIAGHTKIENILIIFFFNDFFVIVTYLLWQNSQWNFTLYWAAYNYIFIHYFIFMVLSKTIYYLLKIHKSSATT